MYCFSCHTRAVSELAVSAAAAGKLDQPMEVAVSAAGAAVLEQSVSWLHHLLLHLLYWGSQWRWLYLLLHLLYWSSQ